MSLAVSSGHDQQKKLANLGSHGMLLLRQSQAGSSSSFLSGFHSGCVDVEQFKANVLAFPHPPYPLCLLPLIPQSDVYLN